MSLSRILNDPPPPAQLITTDPIPIDPTSRVSPSALAAAGTLASRPVQANHSPLDDRGEPSRGYPLQPMTHQGELGGRDSHNGEWVREAVPQGQDGTYHHSGRDRHRYGYAAQEEYAPLVYVQSVKSDVRLRRKRKRTGDDDGLPGYRRLYASSRHPSRENAGSAPPAEGRAVFSADDYAEERRLASSDLEDCEEVWLGDLSEYMLDTQRRLKQVERWFDASVLERSSSTAQSLFARYSDCITRIPLPSPPPSINPVSAEDELRPSRRAGSPLGEKSDAADEFIHPGLEDTAAGAERSDLYMKSLFEGREASEHPGSRASDASSDLEIPTGARREKGGYANKRKRFEKDCEIADELERSVMAERSFLTPYAPRPSGKGKGKGKQVARDHSVDSLKGTRRKPAPRKKYDPFASDNADGLSLSFPPALVPADAVLNESRPPSPAPTTSIVYEIDEVKPPLKRAKKVDEAARLKRVKALEDAQRKAWTNIARRDVAKVYKYHAQGYQTRLAQLERLAKFSATQARRPFVRTAKAAKDVQAKAKRLMREMLVFWKKNEREERDVRKREQKEAIDRAKVEEEKRETARQARKLEFLISQTELYSHFVGSKLKTAEVEGMNEPALIPEAADIGVVDASSLLDIDFDDEDTTNLHRHAKYNAQEAVALAKRQAQQFDTQAALERKSNEANQFAKFQALSGPDPEVEGRELRRGPSFADAFADLDSDVLNFQNPTSLSGDLLIKQPMMLMAQLKEYQLKGLNWLATLYEQGINGILADEMGLGKTVQSISLLAYLAEAHDIWGPFLVVAPASTLHNWQQELSRFVPGLKALPYWGNVKDRATLRKFWSKKEISYNRDAPFHVLITSYQLVTQDQQYFQRVKWQYMILDEAQNIKNSSSVRWKTLLGFQCRNRLLLTGTPIQNNMQELWALLHFIMPSLFDSHDEFNEWFSKDIENAAENKGNKMNEHQLRRLHIILKPFMLRRVKRHVQNELSDKIEKDIYVDLSVRQRALYRALLANVSVADLLEKAANIRDADSARSLMNLVMQFRKVCNHPELFERADVIAPYSFSTFGRSGPLIRDADPISLPYSTRNPIEYVVPMSFYRDGGLLDVPNEQSRSPHQSGVLQKLMNIWSTDWMHHSMYHDVTSSFSFLRLMDMSPGEIHKFVHSSLLHQRLLAVCEEASLEADGPFISDSTFAASSSISPMRFVLTPRLKCLEVIEGLPDFPSISRNAWKLSCLSRPSLKWFVPPVVSPSIMAHCSDRSFLERQSRLIDAPLESMALFGLPLDLRQSEEACFVYNDINVGLPPAGLIGSSPADQLPSPTMQVPDPKRLIYDSAKLARLDSLLQELKAGDHRVLIYFQMTRMMDLMEEYLIHRQYKYLRLDGSSKLEDRRDMVIDWQTRSDIFVFLLSTRAGGLGINLTAADTVVFYDHDWNPSNDAQAMDRAHRLGQTRQVTVYRLIARGTIDERIMRMARFKKDVQDIVVGNKSFTDVAKPSEIVQLLLNDDQLAGLDEATAELSAEQLHTRPATELPEGDPAQDLWNEEGDDFFDHSAPLGAPNTAAEHGDDESHTPAPSAVRGKKRKTLLNSSWRGRKQGGSKTAVASKRKSGLKTGAVTSLDNI